MCLYKCIYEGRILRQKKKKYFKKSKDDKDQVLNVGISFHSNFLKWGGFWARGSYTLKCLSVYPDTVGLNVKSSDYSHVRSTQQCEYGMICIIELYILGLLLVCWWVWMCPFDTYFWNGHGTQNSVVKFMMTIKTIVIMHYHLTVWNNINQHRRLTVY